VRLSLDRFDFIHYLDIPLSYPFFSIIATVWDDQKSAGVKFNYMVAFSLN
jgi:hypothetical protein